MKIKIKRLFGYMVAIKILVSLVTFMVLFTGCGLGDFGAGTPSDVHRGEADAVNPARNVTVVCEKDKNGNTNNINVDITNNCNKNNTTTSSTGDGSEG